MPDRTCEECSAPLAPGRRRFCSTRCQVRGQPPCSVEGCDKPRLARGFCATHYNRSRPPAVRHKPIQIVCAECGCRHTTIRTDGLYCGIQCYTRNRERLRRQPYVPSPTDVEVWQRPSDLLTQKQDALLRSRSQEHRPRIFFSGQCSVCLKWFTSPYTHRQCSTECDLIAIRRARRAANDRRRVRLRAAGGSSQSINRYEIYRRDGFRCWICRRRLAMDQDVPHPMAPTVDHVLPISWGGGNDPANLRAAHFICNARRSDKMAWVQPALM